MNYQITLDDKVLHDYRDDTTRVINPSITLATNTSGELSFTIYETNPCYKDMQILKSWVKLKRDGVVIWGGRIASIETGFNKSKKVTCEGDLSRFNDSVQTPKKYNGVTVRAYLEDLIKNHNTQVVDGPLFSVGTVTVEDTNGAIYRESNYDDTLTCLNDKLLNNELLGGYMKLRYEGAGIVIDYITPDEFNTSNQVISFGENLIDLVTVEDASELATCIIPLGAETDGVKLTVKSVNNNKLYVSNTAQIAKYGRIYKVVENTDITKASNLLKWCKKQLKTMAVTTVTNEINAIDLAMLDIDINAINPLEWVRVVSIPNGVDAFVMVEQIKLDLDKPTSNRLVLSSNEILIEEIEEV